MKMPNTDTVGLLSSPVRLTTGLFSSEPSGGGERQTRHNIKINVHSSSLNMGTVTPSLDVLLVEQQHHYSLDYESTDSPLKKPQDRQEQHCKQYS